MNKYLKNIGKNAQKAFNSKINTKKSKHKIIYFKPENYSNKLPRFN